MIGWLLISNHWHTYIMLIINHWYIYVWLRVIELNENLSWNKKSFISSVALNPWTFYHYNSSLTATILLFVLQSWPPDALEVVAQRFLADVHLPDEVISGCVQLCKEFHMSTRDLSQRFWNELKRHNYVTPTSYLELISTYKTLLSKKQE